MPRSPFLPTALVLALAPSLSACAVYETPLARPARKAVPLSAKVMKRFSYAVISSATLTPVFSDDEVAISDGALKIRVPDARVSDQPGDTLEVRFEYWRSRVTGSSPAPVVLITPILGGGERLARTSCRDFAAAGFHVILAWRATKVLRSSWPLADIEGHLRRAIAARRALLDWAETRPEIDRSRMAAFGISMGGILTSVLLGVEPRLKAGVVALAGGNIPQIIRHSSEGRVETYREVKEADLHLDPPELEAALRRALPSDPLAVAGAVDPRRVFFISDRFDTVVPPRDQDALWRAMGRPLRYDLPTAHYTGILFLPAVTRLVIRWFHQRLRAPAAGLLAKD